MPSIWAASKSRVTSQDHVMLVDDQGDSVKPNRLMARASCSFCFRVCVRGLPARGRSCAMSRITISKEAIGLVSPVPGLGVRGDRRFQSKWRGPRTGSRQIRRSCMAEATGERTAS